MTTKNSDRPFPNDLSTGSANHESMIQIPPRFTTKQANGVKNPIRSEMPHAIASKPIAHIKSG